MPRLAPAVTFLAFAALAAPLSSCSSCKESSPAVPDAGPAAAPYGIADLARASEVDLRFQELLTLVTEWKSEMTLASAPGIIESTAKLLPLLGSTLAALEAAAKSVTHPDDRARLAPLLAAARRWPPALVAVRDELVKSVTPDGGAVRVLAEVDDEVQRTLESYRRFRSQLKIADAPHEDTKVVEFLKQRRELEKLEGQLAARIPEALAAGPDAGLATSEQVAVRLDKALAPAERIAAILGDSRSGAATRWVTAEKAALKALVDLGRGGVDPAERIRLELAYQTAKTEALRAVAEYESLTAVRPKG